MKIQRSKDEFMLLPTFSIDNWYDSDIYKQQHIYMWQRVYTIGWLFWFIRWTGNKVVIDFETQGL